VRGVRRYRKLPAVIDAVRLTEKNLEQAARWCDGEVVNLNSQTRGVAICTLEGTMIANVGDYLIRGVEGEHYPCKPNIFKATYEQVE